MKNKIKYFVFLSPLFLFITLLIFDFIIWGVLCLPTILFSSRTTDIKLSSLRKKSISIISKNHEYAKQVKYNNLSFNIPEYYNYEIKEIGKQSHCFLVSEENGRYLILKIDDGYLLSYNYLRSMKKNLFGIDILNKSGIFNDYNLMDHIMRNPQTINLWYRPLQNHKINEKIVYSMAFSLSMAQMKDFSLFENTDFDVIEKVSDILPYHVSYYVYSKIGNTNIRIACPLRNSNEDNKIILYSIIDTLKETSM